MTDEVPLKLHDGTLVYKDGRVVRPETNVVPMQRPQIIEVPTHREAQQLVVRTRAKLSDLPDVPRAMNPIGVVLSYTLFGLADEEIAFATNLTTKQVGNIKMSDAFTAMHDKVVGNIIASEADDVRSLFVKHSRDAAMGMVNLMTVGKASDRRAAIADVLDRAGLRPADVHEHRHSLDGGLTIEVVRKDVAPTINIDMGSET